ncbi:hypothetical protein JL108_14340 [Aeromicrobium sp. YIM 150415]|uniref:helix-turn-helix domain-containing protein n=1 Tax=Aeromicrobium sp. YIM 150415 TaxID=2803912 RepID=UPI00196657F7|nr:helix-turn-helix domain-containing protein [Aeromicrobium sp. YIM 150415]MBM9464632.1 hypothetical protein [Aeromicrobium sp. YIM 150415]
MSNPPDLVTVAEAATILSISTRAVQHRISNGSLPTAQKLPGRTGSYLLERAAVERARVEMAGKA